MNKFYTLVVLLITASACNRHNVPLGGECEVSEDCGKGTLACFKTAGQSKGVCSTVCQVSPLPNVVSGGPSCESAGLVCKKADKSHGALGDEFCVKP